VEDTLVQVREEDTLRKAEKIIRRINELRASFESIKKTLQAKYSTEPRLKELVENLLQAYSPPPPPSTEQLALASKSLEGYTAQLEDVVRKLASYVLSLEDLSHSIKRLEEEVQHLAVWEERLAKMAPHLASECHKLRARSMRLLSQVPLEDPSRSLDEIELTLQEARRLSRIARGVYEGRVAEAIAMAGRIRKLLEKALRIASMEEAEGLRSTEREVDEIAKLLERARSNPLEYGVDLDDAKSRLSAAESQVAPLISKSLSGEEQAVLRQLERAHRLAQGKSMSIAALADAVSRSTGLPVEEVLKTIYSLSRKGLVDVRVRVLYI